MSPQRRLTKPKHPRRVFLSHSIDRILGLQSSAPEEDETDNEAEAQEPKPRTQLRPVALKMLQVPDGNRRRPRITFSDVQLVHLMRCFTVEPFPDIRLRNALACNLHVQESRIHVWFQNQRAKARKSGTLKRTAASKYQVIPPIYLMPPPTHMPHIMIRPMYAPSMPLPNLPGPYGPWSHNWCTQYAGVHV